MRKKGRQTDHDEEEEEGENSQIEKKLNRIDHEKWGA